MYLYARYMRLVVQKHEQSEYVVEMEVDLSRRDILTVSFRQWTSIDEATQPASFTRTNSRGRAERTQTPSDPLP